MSLRILIAALAIWGMAWSNDASAVYDDGGEWRCVYGSTSGGGTTLPQFTCWYNYGYGGGGSGGGYVPPPSGGGGGLPSRSGYEIYGNVYVKEDGSEVDASHLYSCDTPWEILQDVVQYAKDENPTIPIYGEVVLRLSDGSWMWNRIDIQGEDQFEPVIDSNCG